ANGYLASLFHFLLLSLTFVILAHAATAPPNPPPPPLTAAASEYLEAHNEARAVVGVEPLRWSEKLGNASSLMVRYQRNKMKCEFANLTTSKYGGNQLWAGVTTVAPRVAVEEWVKEKEHAGGVGNSTEVGCAEASCVKEKSSLTICFYDPPGNVIGESPY
ncbi:STS14 protein-like, partial [Vigna umbellata]|uniref:STS14 protein-like n=1 Tax=Vigna umbellata TaxID=87088 RepID=UPI001F5E90AD